LTVGRPLPVYPDEQTFSEPVGMSQRCHFRTFSFELQIAPLAPSRSFIYKMHVRSERAMLDGERSAPTTGRMEPPPEASMIDTTLSTTYREYIDCLNRQDWAELEQFVHAEVHHNGERIGLSGYREMLERDFREIPDLRFDIQLLVCEPPCIASRLGFNCTPKGSFLGLEVNGRKVSFAENVFYEFDERRIKAVWSIIDKAAIERKL
jgi:predicted ester cyclase